MRSPQASHRSTSKLSDILARLPRVNLAHLPTPFEYLPRLSQALGGPDIYVKRDDCTGLATGGNKTRKLEFVMADARANGATHVVTQGAVQSNHARQTAAAACKMGMKSTLLFEHRVANPSEDYLRSGNLLFDRLYGAEILNFEKGADMNAGMAKVSEALRKRGETPYIIPGGASTPTGALGYVDCAREILLQADELNLQVDQIVLATGSAGTQAGLLTGLRVAGSDIPVLGIGVNAPRDVQEERVFRLAEQTADLIEHTGAVTRGDVVANCDFIGDGYGVPTAQMVDAVLMLARLEGLLFDPVYSGKGLAGLISLIRSGYFSGCKTIVFVHTGGSAGLFAYREVFDRALAQATEPALSA